MQGSMCVSHDEKVSAQKGKRQNTEMDVDGSCLEVPNRTPVSDSGCFEMNIQNPFMNIKITYFSN